MPASVEPVSHEGLHLLMSSGGDGCGETSPRGRGMQLIGGVMRLVGLERLFASAQRKPSLNWIGLNILRAGVRTDIYTCYSAEDRQALTRDGDKLVTRGEQLMKQAGGTGVMNTWEEARYCLSEAAELYLRAGDKIKAAEALCVASECMMKLGAEIERCSYLVRAAEHYREIAPMEAVACLQRVIKSFDSQGRFQKVAKHERLVAEIYEGVWRSSGTNVDLEHVLLHYRQAADYYNTKPDNKHLTESNHCLEKVAEYKALIGAYVASIETFETLHGTMTGEKLKAECLFRALLCHLAQITVDNRLPGIEKAEAAFEQYTEMRFCQGVEYDLVKKLLTTVKGQDMNGFEKAVEWYVCLRDPDEWVRYMLKKIGRDLEEVLDAIDRQTFSR